MPWYSSYSRSSYSTPRSSTSPWTTQGETMSLDDAMVKYELTEKQVFDSGIEVRCRSYFGNPYRVCIVDEICALAKRVSPKFKLIEEIGQEEYDRRMQAKRDAAKAKEESAKNLAQLNRDFEALLYIVSASPTMESSSGILINQKTAMKDFRISRNRLEALAFTKHKRSNMYQLCDVIGVWHKRSESYIADLKNESGGQQNHLPQIGKFFFDKLKDDAAIAKGSDDPFVAALAKAKADLEANPPKHDMRLKRARDMLAVLEASASTIVAEHNPAARPALAAIATNVPGEKSAIMTKRPVDEDVLSQAKKAKVEA